MFHAIMQNPVIYLVAVFGLTYLACRWDAKREAKQ